VRVYLDPREGVYAINLAPSSSSREDVAHRLVEQIAGPRRTLKTDGLAEGTRDPNGFNPVVIGEELSRRWIRSMKPSDSSSTLSESSPCMMARAFTRCEGPDAPAASR
jgi:hypothetical protein